MRRAKCLLWLPATAALAVLWASCAPVDPPSPSDPARRENPDAPPPPPRVTPVKGDVGRLRDRVEAALQHVWSRDLDTTNGFWTVFHGILGMGFETTLLDRMTGKKVNALEHICSGGEMRGLEFVPTADGLDVGMGETFVAQGHQDQFVAEMGQWGIAADRKFVVYGKDYTFMDFVRHSQMKASTTSKQELSWAVVIIGQYVGTNAKWTNRKGEKLTFEDVVRYELKEPVDGAACGGTHRLFGLTWAYHLHLRNGGKTEGVWKDVVVRLEEYKLKARKYQNPDGTFSTKYLEGPGNVRDVQQRIGTTGHVLEWLALSLSSSELRDPWVQEAANALSLMILDSAGRSIDGGGLYHATHGLHIYHDRVFGPVSGRQAPRIPLPPGEELPKSAPVAAKDRRGR